MFWREGPLLKVTWASWGTWALGITRGEEGAKNNLFCLRVGTWFFFFFQKLNCVLDVLELSLGWEPHNFVT